jgi:hypothetical protein
MAYPRSVFRAAILCLAAAACTTQPSWQASPQPISTALMRVDRGSVMAAACFYDRQPVPCGDYLLQRLVPMLDNRPQIRDLSLSDTVARCRADGAGTLCEVSSRVRFTQAGRTWPVRVDMRYRAPEHQAYVVGARYAPNPLADASFAPLAPIRDVLDRLVASIAQESERATRVSAL